MGLSCSCEEYDIMEVSRRFVIARKPHKCVECLKVIGIGESFYMASFYNFDVCLTEKPEFQCEECGDMYENFTDLGYCIAYGDVKDALTDYREAQRALR